MGDENRIIFDPFCLDRSNECLWRGSQVIKLRPKAYAVLNQLVGRPGQLVTKEELLTAVWPETFVGDAVLKVTIRQLRDALDDDPKTPLFIETAHRRGYRFIGQIADSGQMPAKQPEITDVSTLRRRDVYPPLGIVGRNEALSRMRSWLETMLRGERQIVFVTGEAGIGKTALVDTFARYLAFDRKVRIGRGQCLEQYGTGEAYLPILEAIGRLCREEASIVEVLRAHAPMWLLQMPALLSVSEREALGREMVGATRERMLREMGETLEVLTSDHPLVLILEDLHWSDWSTLDLISYLATQRRPAHLLLIGTYRTVELVVSGHPLQAVKQELLVKQQCEELPLAYLSEDAIAKYLSVRFPTNRFPAELAGLIHERTEGNPLFMVNAVDYLMAQGLVSEHEKHWELAVEIENVEVGVPDSIKQMIEKQLDHLDAEQQRTLEVASVAGAEFSALAVGAGLGGDRAAVEARCNELARHRQFIQDCGIQELPNGEVVARYGFIHALYRKVLYERVSMSRRAQLHLRIAEEGEEVYGERVGEIAGELAMHFELGRDYKRAAKHFQRAADNAIRRFAYREAVGLARQGLELLESLPNDTEHAEQELCLQLTLGVPLIATQGYAASDVGNVYLRAREICQQLGETPDVAEVLWGLWTFYIVSAQLGMARNVAEEFLSLAERLPYPGLAMRGHLTMQVTFLYLGEFASSLDHFEKALTLYDPEQHRDDAFLYSQNPGVAMRSHAAWALWFIGRPDQALVQMHEALAMARALSEPHGLAHVYYFASILHHMRREDQLAQENAEAAIAVSNEHGLVMWKAYATITRGWALIEQGHQEEAIELMRQGLALLQVMGAEVARPHLLSLLADVLGKTRRADEGLEVLKEALEIAHRNNQFTYLAELYRTKGELLLIQAKDQRLADAEACFQQSLEIAKQQLAKSCELRTATSLARLYRDQNKQKEARGLLAEVYDSFSEGFETLDLREAKAMLAALAP